MSKFKVGDKVQYIGKGGQMLRNELGSEEMIVNEILYNGKTIGVNHNDLIWHFSADELRLVSDRNWSDVVEELKKPDLRSELLFDLEMHLRERSEFSEFEREAYLNRLREVQEVK